MPASEATIKLAFEGPALAEGLMDVRDLAPALLALGDLCQEANRVLNGPRAKVSVHVQATRQGSFIINLEIIQDLLTQAVALFQTDQIKSAIDVLKAIGVVAGAGASLLGFLKWLRGLRATEATVLQDGNIRISVEGNNNAIVVSRDIVNLANDPRVRESVRGLTRPLENTGIEKLEFRTERDEVTEAITKRDLPELTAFEVDGDVLEQDERVALVEVIKPSFQDDLKWILSEGSGNFGVTMEDPNYLERVAQRATAFAHGHMLRVRLRTKKIKNKRGLRADIRVVEVLEEYPATQQLPLIPPLSPH